MRMQPTSEQQKIRYIQPQTSWCRGKPKKQWEDDDTAKWFADKGMSMLTMMNMVRGKIFVFPLKTYVEKQAKRKVRKKKSKEKEK